MNHNEKIFVAGHGGMVGSSIVRKLRENGYNNIITFSKNKIDLRDSDAVYKLFEQQNFDHVFLAAARVGGIMANNQYKGSFIYDNLMIQTNVIHNAFISGVKKLLFLGSSCIYPKFAEQPIKEDYLLSGKLEDTNDAYAIAKIAGIKMCQSYAEQYGFNAISLIPSNLYGPGDNFNLTTSHVLSATMSKIHHAKLNNKSTIECWGTGEVKREFLYVDDLADACVFLMNNYDSSEIINVGVGHDITIKELVYSIFSCLNYKGDVVWDLTKPDGTSRKLLDITKITNLGWKVKTDLMSGLEKTYESYLKSLNNKY